MTKTGNILIVDDNRHNLLYLSSLLENKNYNTVSANSGKQAFTSLERHIPDLILLDINMPEMNGFEVCKTIKQNKILAKIPIIFLTGASEKHVKLEGFKLGAVDYITKPYESEELLARVKTHIDLFFLNKKLNEQTQQLKQKNEQYAILNQEYSALDIINQQIIKELKEAKEITEESEGKLKNFIDSATDCFFLFDKNLNCININQKALKLFFPEGTTKNNIIGNNINNIMPDTAKNNKYLNVIKTGTPYTINEYVPHTTLGNHYVTIKTFRAGDGLGMVIINTTKQIKAKEKLKKQNTELKASQYYLQKAQEIGKIGTWSLDIKNNILTWTAENYKIFGIPQGTKLTYETFIDCIHPNDIKYVNDKWSDALKNMPYDNEHRIIVNNQTKWVREKAKIEFDNNGEAILCLGFTQDITKIKQTESKLKLSEERFRKLSDLTFEGIIIQRKGFVIDINKAFTKMCKYKRKKLIGKNIIDLIIPDKYRLMFKEKIEQEHMLPYELEMLQKDGSTIPVEIESLELQYNEESLKVIAFRDLTEKKEQGKQVLNAMIETEEKERERFSSELHDGLGPLLSVLKIYFQMLAETNDKNKIKIIKSNANQNIDEAISAVDEISNNITPRTLRTFGFKAAIRTFISRLKNLNIVNIDFYCNFEVRIELNIETLVYRIITELINNTLKYAQATKINISAKLSKAKDNLSIHYSDNGIGFDFANTINLNKGLGLINIQQRIKVLGSFLEYKTKPNEGVNVYFECKISKSQ